MFNSFALFLYKYKDKMVGVEMRHPYMYYLSIKHFWQILLAVILESLIYSVFNIFTLLGCVNDLHTWQFPTNRPAGRSAGRPTGLEEIILFC